MVGDRPSAEDVVQESFTTLGSEVPRPNWWYTPGRFVWEDNTHVLLEEERSLLVRCNIDTGACERIFTAATNYNLDLIEQDPYKALDMG